LRKGKQEGMDSKGRTGGQRKERRGGRGRGTEKRVKRREGEISPPRSFLKVGAYSGYRSNE